jgi:uncharacterized membrane protein
MYINYFISFHTTINSFARKSNCLNLKKKSNLNSIITIKEQRVYSFFLSKVGNISRSHENRIQYFKFFNLGFSFLGACETIYLTINKLNGSLSMCSNQTCTIVLDSVFSNFIGIPISLLGALLYVAIFFFIYKNLIESDLKRKYSESAWLITFLFQFILCFFSSYFSVILKLFLQSNCPWCALSMLISTLILFFSCMSKNGNKILNLSNILLFIGGGTFIIYCLFFLNILELLSDVL